MLINLPPVSLTIILLSSALVSALWPLPRSFEHGSAVLWLALDVDIETILLPNSDFGSSTADQIVLQENSSSPILSSSEEVLKSAIDRMKHRLYFQNIVPRKFHPKITVFEPDWNAKNKHITSIMIEQVEKFDIDKPQPNEDEAYTIEVTEDADAVILAKTIQGALHGLETFSQLFYAHSKFDDRVYTPFAPIRIDDGPAFKHRGLNLDISRNSISPKAVKRTIEAMACSKLNKLHLHASDAQSWPLDIPTMESLARKGAYDVDQIWKAHQLQEVQRHGQLHGVEVYIEIDLPGHTTAIAGAFPDLITAANEHNWSHYALEPPSGQLKLNSTKVKTFVSSMLHDLLPRVSPFSSLFHIGGDELNLNAYKLDNTVNSSARAILKPLLQQFTDDVIEVVESHSMHPVVWEEMLLDWDLNLPSSAAVQSWRSTEALAKILDRGHKALFGSNTHWYLDCGYGGFLDPDPSNPDSSVRPPYTDYCGPYKNWRHVYSYDPLSGLPEKHRDLVLGGEVHLWGELTDDVTLDGMLWPRAAAAAEVMWSGPGRLANEDTTRRLAELRERLVAMSVGAGMVQMEWCLRNRGGCRL